MNVISKITDDLNALPTDIIRDALSNLYMLKQRSLLALIGIGVGTAAIVALLTIGYMAQREVTKIFQASGVDLLVIQLRPGSNNTGIGPALNPRIISALPYKVPEVRSAAMLATGADMAFLSGQYQQINIAATEPLAQKIAGLHTSAGRQIGFVDGDNLVTIVGWNIAQKISHAAPYQACGTYIQLGNYNFKIIGVLRKRPLTTIDPIDFNNGAIIPMGSAHRALAQPNMNTALVLLHPDVNAEDVAKKVQSVLQDATPDADLNITSAEQFIKTLKAQKAVQMRLLAAIGGVSLLVGGIGVMNVMLMSMMERRREIGIRMAIGATPRDIQVMFLVEATILAFCGGVLGTLLGIAIAFFVAQTSGWVFSIALYALPLGVCLAASVGIIFGVYPAITASRQNPIEALHVA